MAKVSKSYQELIQLVQAINVLSGNKEHVESNNKGIKKLQKIGAKLKVNLEEYNEKIENIRLDNANVDEQGCLTLDDKGGYKFSKEGLRSLNKQAKDLIESKFEFYQFTFSNEGIETYAFLEGWVEGLVFPSFKEEDDEITVIPMEEV